MRVSRTTPLDVLGLSTAAAMRAGVVEPSVTVASGKGRDEEEAEVTACFEALERYAGEPRGRVETTRARQLDLPSAVEPESLVLAWWSRYQAGVAIEWCEGASIATGARVWIPANAVFFPYSPPREEHLFAASTTGLAAGAAWPDAVLHGLLEVVERDQYSMALARLGRGLSAGHALAPEPLGPEVASLAARVERAGARLFLRDITADLKVPVITAVVAEGGMAHLGCAAHPSAEIAASAAILEAAQSRATDIQGAREDLLPREPGDEPHRWFVDPSLPVGPPPPSFTTDRVDEEVRWVMGRLAERAFSPVLVDLSIHGVSLPVVRVIVPLLEQWGADGDRAGARVLACAS